MSIDKPRSGDSDPDQHERSEPRPVNWDLSKPLPDWAKPGYADRRPPAPPPQNVPTMDEIRERRAAFSSSSEYDKASRSGYFDSPAWKNRNGEDPSETADRTETGGHRADKPPVLQRPDTTRPPQAEAANGDREQPKAAKKADSPDKATDTRADNAADKNADRVSELENDNSKLIDTLSMQADRIDRQDAKIEKLESERDAARAEAAGAKAENTRLKAELARQSDQGAGGQSAVDESTGTVPGQDLGERAKTADRPWYKKRPSQAATELATAGATAVETVGVATHAMSSTAETMVGAFIGLGVAALAYERAKKKEKDEHDG